jgi:hypothetical protein
MQGSQLKSELQRTGQKQYLPEPNEQEPNQPQHDRPADCFITQQYSSATLVTQRFHVRMTKFGLDFKKLVHLLPQNYFKSETT